MVFSSLLFLFYFLPAVLAVYFIVPRRAKNVVLLLFSLFFYAWGEPVYIFLMLFSICMDYLLGLWMERAKQAPGRAKKVLALAVVLNVALLGFFKYADFFVENLNALTGLAIPALQIPLPIGISFLYVPGHVLPDRFIPGRCAGAAQYHLLRHLCFSVPAAHRRADCPDAHGCGRACRPAGEF